MYHPDPYDEYPISDGTIEVTYRHKRVKYVRLSLYQDFVVDLDSKPLEYFSKNATITGGLTNGTNPLSYVEEGSDYIKNHIDEMVSKAIEVIPEARATNCVYVDIPGSEGMRWKRVWGSQQNSQWTMVSGF